MSTQRSPLITLPAILLTALVLRWGYALILYSTMADDGLTGLDSLDYLNYTRSFITDIAKGHVAGWQWLGNNLHMMPFFAWLLAACLAIGSAFGSLLYVLVQGLTD